MRQSMEETAQLPNGIELCYDTFGNRGSPALLLIMGLAGPLTWWAQDLCRLLASRDFFVVRYDNRDVGKSTKLGDHATNRTAVVKTFLRGSAAAPYTMSDLATDAAGLLDHLDIRQAHVTGASMGGMIAQTLALEHPDRVLSLVSIMSTTGRRFVGRQDPRLYPRFLAPGRNNSRGAYIERSARTWAAIGSPGYPTPAEETRERAAETYDRGISFAGVLRQIQAVLTQPDRTTALHGLTMPVLVIHGLSDRLVNVSGGRATAAAIPCAELLLIPGMGHDLPTQVWPLIADGIERTAKRARSLS
ncbi:MAG: alpha/beta fold hydrolase [Nocardioidaceae bacterium]